MWRTFKLKNKTKGKQESSKKLVKRKAGKAGLQIVPYNAQNLGCDYCKGDRDYMYAASRWLRRRMLESKVWKKKNGKTNQAMAGLVTCSRYLGCDSLRHCKHVEEGEDENGGEVDWGETQETDLADAPLNKRQYSNWKGNCFTVVYVMMALTFF